MAEHHERKHHEVDTSAGYEVTDVRTNVITVFLASVAGMTLFAIIAIIVIMRGMEVNASRSRQLASPLDTPQAELPEAGIARLQQDPVAERKAIVAAAEKELTSYGIRKEAGVENGADIIHIPIDRAIELVGSGAVPYRQEPVAAALDEANAGEEAVQ